ncbi:MAG: multicopper oxidase domain-containing protein, partial [bacterium]
LPIPGVMPQAGPDYYEIGMWEIEQQLHPQLQPTTLWAYGTSQATATYPGATIVAARGVPIQVRWTNNLPMNHLLEDAVDSTLHMAMPEEGVPVAVHLHGGEVEPGSDGGPDAWFTPGFAEKGPGWQYEVYTYPNAQRAFTTFYHDHALGMTRLNVYAGLAGGYVLLDPANEPEGLPTGAYDLPLVIQDRMFTEDGELFYPYEGDNPEHPIWTPEFFGDVMVVNGKVWPYLEVEPRMYRFRIINGSNSRVYSMALAERTTSAPGPAFIQIASDGGLLAEPVTLNAPGDPHSPRLVLATGERAEIVVDFAGWEPGTEFLLKNVGKAPFPNGESADPQTVGQIMLFRVVPLTDPDESAVPPVLATVDRLSDPTVTRTLTLNEIMGEEGPLEAVLNGTPWDAPETETPVLGTTELWEIVNLTGDTHPIHIHLVQFQLLNRQRVNIKRYQAAFDAANPEIPSDDITPVPVGPYLKGRPTAAPANESGWKDTFQMHPGEVTRVLVRFATQEGEPFPFDATAEPGYVWHCHIVEHEDNEMMRPYHLTAPAAVVPIAEATAAPVARTDASPTLQIRGGTLRFSLATSGPVSIDLYDVTGRRVSTLVRGWQEAGEHSLPWESAVGQRLTAGMYFVRLEANSVVRTRRPVTS